MILQYKNFKSQIKDLNKDLEMKEYNKSQLIGNLVYVRNQIH